MKIEPETKRNIFVIVGLGIIMFLVGLALGDTMSTMRHESIHGEELRLLLENAAVDHKATTTIVNSRVKSLEEALSASKTELSVLADLITKLKDKVDDVKYIVKVEKIFMPGETVYVSIKDLPDEYLYKVVADDQELVVGSFKTLDDNGDGVNDKVELKAYELGMQLDAALGEKSSSFLLRMKTSYDNKMHDIPIQANVTYIDDEAQTRKLIKPELSLQVGGFAGSQVMKEQFTAGYTVGVSMPWLHITPQVDVLSPEILIGQAFYPQFVQQQTSDLSDNIVVTDSQFVMRAGFGIASFNIASSGNTLLTDTWVGADVSVGTDLSVAGGIILGTRL